MHGIETANGHEDNFVLEDNFILIVNDEPDQLTLMGTLLRKAGYSVLTAEDGVEGLSLARREQPDLVISDVSMPRMNGLHATREILHRHAGTRVILLTSDDDYETARTGFEVGALGYVVKDNMISDLPDAIEAVLAGKVFLSGCVVRHACAYSHESPQERDATTAGFTAL